MKREEGFIGEAVGILIVLGLVVGFFWLLASIKWQTSDDVVSGIVYNNSNDALISGNTTFSIRASVDTYVNSSNESDFCLPAGSPYIPLVKQAAADKNIKVTVTASKKFEIMSPWGCMDNVTVTRNK